MDVGEAESEAMNRATLLVANMLQRPDQLQKVDQYRLRVQRKKESVEAMLKTAMQSQLDGVRTGLSQLQAALVDLKDIKSGLSDMEDSLVRVPELSEQLYECREEYVRHSQYAAAMENLKHIFTVPESVEKTQKWIQEGRLLYAHQVFNIEISRSPLAFIFQDIQLKFGQSENRIASGCQIYLAGLLGHLGKQVWVILQRALNTVRKEPAQIVTALRIIEREERADQFALQRQKGTGFLPVGRPKKWREKAFMVLEESVKNRIEGNQFEDREMGKNWLIKHLEVIRLLTLEDMKVIRSLCVPCFPPHYDITNRYLQMYHNNLASHEILVNLDLQTKLVIVMTSQKLLAYAGTQLICHTSGINNLSLQTMKQIKIHIFVNVEFFNNSKGGNEEAVARILKIHKPDTLYGDLFQNFASEYYKFENPLIYRKNFRQVVEVYSVVPEVQVQVLICSLEQVRLFASKYQAAVTRYKNTYYNDRSQITYFTHYMVALANSCQALMDVMVMVKSQFWRPGGASHTDAKVATEFDALIHTYQRVRDIICDFLLEEALFDLQEQFSALLTHAWVNDDTPMETIRMTLSDYFTDYTHLHQKNFDHVVELALNTVAMRYATAILQKRMTLKTNEERKQVADRIIADAEKLQGVFITVAPDLVKFDSPCEVLKGLAEVIKVSDLEFLGLELHRLLRRYPDLSNEHLTALLLLRGDLGRLEVRQRVAEIMEEMKNQRTGPAPKSILSHVHVSNSLFP
ncbi:unnamed protein product, partial [Meganyctiphanes norvegica]